MARLERRPAEHVAVAGIIVQALTGGIVLVYAKISGASSSWVLAWQSLIGVAVWIICLTQLRQKRLAEAEREDWERLQAERAVGGARGRLFEEDEIQAFAARNRLRILEKYLAPGFAAVAGVLMLLVVLVALLTRVVAVMEMDPRLAMAGVAMLSAITFALFLIAMYASGMAQQVEWRDLRAGASYMMLTALLSAACAVAFALGQFRMLLPDDVMAYIMLAALAVVGIEMLLNFVLDFYRPRVEGVESRPGYDSRLLSLIAQPGGILKTVTATLDYQFGFRVSQTWFYRFLEQAIAPLVLFQILTLYFLSCVVIVGPEQQCIVERYGKFKDVGGVIGPGLHLKWPWPIERVYRFPVNEIKTFYLGHSGPQQAGNRFLWTVKHYQTELPVMVATRAKAATERELPVNLLVADMTIRYRINDVRKWYYSSVDPEHLLEGLCTREQIKYLAGVDFMEVMGVGRERASTDMALRMQAAADDVETTAGRGMGAEIVSVGLEGMHPPVEGDLPQVFHGLVVGVQRREVTRLNAEKSAVETVVKAQSDAQVMQLQAQKDYVARVDLAEAEAKRFLVQNEAFLGSTEVFKVREFLSALEDGVGNARKYVIGVKGLDRENLRLNLEDPSTMDVTDIGKFRRPITDEEQPKPQ